MEITEKTPIIKESMEFYQKMTLIEYSCTRFMSDSITNNVFDEFYKFNSFKTGFSISDSEPILTTIEN